MVLHFLSLCILEGNLFRRGRWFSSSQVAIYWWSSSFPRQCSPCIKWNDPFVQCSRIKHDTIQTQAPSEKYSSSLAGSIMPGGLIVFLQRCPIHAPSILHPLGFVCLAFTFKVWLFQADPVDARGSSLLLAGACSTRSQEQRWANASNQRKEEGAYFHSLSRQSWRSLCCYQGRFSVFYCRKSLFLALKYGTKPNVAFEKLVQVVRSRISDEKLEAFLEGFDSGRF